MELTNVKWFTVSDEVNIENKGKTVKAHIEAENAGENTQDFSSGPEEITMVTTPDQAYGQFLSRMDEPEIRKQLQGKNIYEITVKNIGGLVMPLTIEWQYTDGTSEIDTLPAEIWRTNEYEITKTFIKTKEVKKVVLDPNFEYADTDTNNNSFPKVEELSDFDKFKSKNKN
jgi:hypothetical protein